jgi:ribosome maturation factor RimP
LLGEKVDSVELEKRIELIVEAGGFRLISANWAPIKGKLQLKVVADAEDHNITINECGDLSRAISDLLDCYPHEYPDYRLEVSSPGLSHPLESWQFQKNVGRTVEVRYFRDGQQLTYKGELCEASDAHYTVQTGDEERQFKFSDLDQVYVVPTFTKG